MGSGDNSKQPTGLALYNRAAEAASRRVIATYSTSFGWATKLLGRPVRQHVVNIYALVRVADEIVDGAASEAHALGGAIDAGQALDQYESAVYQAFEDGFATDLVIHAFARTANECGFGADLVAPFFRSMRADLTQTQHDQASFEDYIYGSAEVVGLMCLAAFVHTAKGGPGRYTETEKATMVAGARALGSAFQKVNFLRDLAADFEGLGRSYFPEVRPGHFDDAVRDRLVADIDQELAAAERSLALLPRHCVRAVWAALLLFGQLNAKIAQTEANELIRRRIRVNNLGKLIIMVRAALLPIPKGSARG